MTLSIMNHHPRQHWLKLTWHLPEGIRVSSGVESDMYVDQFTGKTSLSTLSFEIVADTLPKGTCELLLEITVHGHPSRLFLPLTFFKV